MGNKLTCLLCAQHGKESCYDDKTCRNKSQKKGFIFIELIPGKTTSGISSMILKKEIRLLMSRYILLKKRQYLMPPDDTMLPDDYENNDGDNGDYPENGNDDVDNMMIMVKEAVMRMMMVLEEARMVMIKVATSIWKFTGILSTKTCSKA